MLATSTHDVAGGGQPRRRRAKLLFTVLVGMIGLGLAMHLVLLRDWCLWSKCASANTRRVSHCPISGTPLALLSNSVKDAVWTFRGFRTYSVNTTGRPFPKVFVIGTHKCGTGPLVDMISKHPNFRIAVDNTSRPITEVPYFNRPQDEYETLGVGWYLQHWAHLSREDWRDAVLADMTANYLADGHAPPRRMIETFPAEASHFRFVVLMCNPMERAYSVWQQFVRQKFQGWPADYTRASTFGAFVREFLTRMSKCVDSLPTHIRHDETKQFQACQDLLPDMLYRGMYWQQLLVWFKYFEPHQFFIVDSEQLYGKHAEVWQRRLRQHIGLHPDIPFQPPRPHVPTHRKLAEDDPVTYRILDRFYAPFSAALIRTAPLCSLYNDGVSAWHDPALLEQALASPHAPPLVPEEKR